MEEVRATAVCGELGMRMRSRYGATLSDPYTGRYLVPVLDHVVIDVRREGMLLTGVEVVPRRSNPKSACDHWPQKWWCVLMPRPPQPPGPMGRDRDIDKMVRSMGKMQ